MIDIVHKLGHCTSYNAVCEIKTAEAECALEEENRSNILKLRPSIKETVFTYFWVDNFDIKVEIMEVGGSINTTHLMTYQKDQNHATNTMTIIVPRRKSCKLFYENIHMEIENQTYCQEKLPLFNKLHFIWVYTRRTIMIR